MFLKLFSLIVVALVFDIGQCQTSFRFSNIFGDNMVLQQSPSRSQIWGYSTSSGDTITAQIIVTSTNEVVQKLEYVTDTSLIWWFQFSPIIGLNNYEYTISITSSLLSQTISLNNILFGDVYVCSGQSNMQFTVDSAFNNTQEINNVNNNKNYENIRLFTVGLIGAATPQIELPSIMQEWTVANGKSISGGNWTYFSALCWYYGKNLFDNLDYPIGLVASSYGGTPIEDWMSLDALNICNDTIDRPLPDSKRNIDSKLEAKLKLFEKLNNNNNNKNSKKNNEKNYYDNIKNIRKNDPKNVFEKSGLMLKSQTTSNNNNNNNNNHYDNIKTIIPHNVNGLNFTDLWNAMIVPLLFETIKGVIWYQGESDGLYPFASEYTCTFPSMINSWRYEWSLYSDTSSLFPFGFIQLSVWDDSTQNVTCNNNYDCTAVAAVRFGQTCNYGYIPNMKLNDNIFMATAIDLGDPTSPYTDIHPRYKQQVAKRLSNAAMNVIYGYSNIYINGPIADYANSVSSNNTLQINFRNVGEYGLNIKNSIGFELFSSENDVYWFDAPLKSDVKAINGFTIELVLDSSVIDVSNVEFVRYNWYTAPCLPTKGIYNCAVYDMQYELPAMPFFIEVIN